MWFWTLMRLLGLDSVLGMILARDEEVVVETDDPPATTDPPPAAATDDPNPSLDLARELEAKNRRIAELEALSEEKIRQEAEAIAYEMYPGPEEPPPSYRRPQPRHDDLGGDPAPDGEPEIPDRMALMEAQIQDMRIEDAARELNRELESLGGKYAHMDRRRILMDIARSGQRPVNLEAMARTSHNVRLQELEEYRVKRNTEEFGTVPPGPPKVPKAPAGAPVPTPKITATNASSVLMRRMKERMGWGQ